MAQYSKLKLTNLGLELLTKVKVGAVKLDFTRFGLGNGTFYFPGDVPGLTALANEKLSRPVLGVAKIARGSFKVATVIATKNLPDQGFDITEVGLFATDPDLGEILYGVIYAGTKSDHLPPKSQGIPYDYVLNLIVSVGDELEVVVKIDEASSATRKELNDHIQDQGLHVTQVEKDTWNEHPKKKDNPHEVTKEQVGLGQLPNKKSDSLELDDSNSLATSKAVEILNKLFEVHKTNGETHLGRSQVNHAIALARVGQDVNLPYVPTPEEMLERRMLQRNGAQLRKADYPMLFARIGRMYTPSGTAPEFFWLPDDRGLFERFLDGGVGRDPEAAQRTKRPDGVTGNNVGTFQDDQFPSHPHSVPAGNPGGVYWGFQRNDGSAGNGLVLANGGSESRPVNIYKWGGIFYDPASL